MNDRGWKVGALLLAVVGAMLIIFSGCAPKQEQVYVDRIVEVKVPVTQEIRLKRHYLPRLPIDTLTQDSTAGEVASAYRQTVDILIRHVIILESQLKPFWDQ